MDQSGNLSNHGEAVASSPLLSHFFGSYEHTIDAKGRIIIPTPFRAPLGEAFVITIGMDDVSIALYPEAAFNKMIESLFGLNTRIPSVQRLQDHIAKYSYPAMQADGQGRILLPSKLRQYVLGNTKALEISGAIDHIRIVSSSLGAEEDEFYQTNRMSIRNEIAALSEKS